MRFIKVIKDIFSIEELRTRIITTIGYLIIFRLGSFILLPGLDYQVIQESINSGDNSGLLGLIDNFLGGAFNNKSIFGLGIMPYISASIIMQLLQIAVPSIQKMQKEGESGRKRFNQITRVLTIVICVVQSVGFITLINNQTPAAVVFDPRLFTFVALCVLTAGTMFCMWLGERITEKGIGNGISMLIMIGIISRLPFAVIGEVSSKGVNNLLILVIELVLFILIVMFAVMITQAARRIPVNYAKQVVGNRVYGSGQRNYIPLKVNTAGVMPIIFAQSLMFLPPILFKQLAGDSESMKAIATAFQDYTSWTYSITSAVLIVLFTFFYTAIIINPQDIADNLKRSGGFIPGVKPGEATANFIDDVLSKITFPGALFIAIIALMPSVVASLPFLKVTQGFAQFFGGTSLLILVGVVLDTLQQIESYLLLRQYDGMMKSGKLKGRSQEIAVA